MSEQETAESPVQEIGEADVIDPKEAKREEKLHKDAARTTAQAKSGERSRFDELVVGRFYRAIGKSDEHIGEIVEFSPGVVHLGLWLYGKPSGQVLSLEFKSYKLVEISRERAHELTQI